MSSEKASIDLLLSALDGDQNISAVKKKLNDIGKDHEVPKYVDKTVKGRAERVVAYNESSKDMGKWQDLVVTNRHASTLDIAQDKRVLPSARALVHKFEPRTDMENEIKMILMKNNSHSDEAIERSEADELAARDLNPEEIKLRQAELGKVKSLLFYEQLKQHRVNKIKSKAYHRIKKRQKTRKENMEKELIQQSGDQDLIQSMEDDQSFERMKERMGLKHKNTGKWARMAKEFGKHDKDLRAAYNESVKHGHELTSKMEEVPHSKRSQNDQDDDGDADWSDEENSDKTSAMATKKLSALFDPSNNDDEEEENGGEGTYDGKYKKIFEMDFMKKAVEHQRTKAKMEAQDILKELRQMEMDEAEGGDVFADDTRAETETEGGSAINSKENEQAIMAAKKQVDSMFGSDQSTGMNISMNKTRNKRKSSSHANSGEPLTAQEQEGSDDVDRIFGSLQEGEVEDSELEGNTTRSSSNNKSGAENSKNKTKKSKVSGSGSTAPGYTPESVKSTAVLASSSISTPSDELNTQDAKDQTTTSSSKSTKKGGKEKKPLLLQKSQEDLVSVAFAAPDLQQEFNQLKKDGIDAELGIDEKRNAIINQGVYMIVEL